MYTSQQPRAVASHHLLSSRRHLDIAYESLEHRAQVRDEVRDKGIWPPKGSPKGGLRYQDNKIVFAAPFSPLQ